MGHRTVLEKQKHQKEKQYSLCSSNILDYPSTPIIDRAAVHEMWPEPENQIYARRVMIARCFHSHSVLVTLKNLNLLSESMVQFELKKISHVMEEFLQLNFPLPNTHFEIRFLFNYHFYLLNELIIFNVATFDDFNQFLNIYKRIGINELNHLMLLKIKVLQSNCNDKDKIIALMDRSIINGIKNMRSIVLNPRIVTLWAQQEFEADHLNEINVIMAVMETPVLYATLSSDNELDKNSYVSLKSLLVLYEQYLNRPETIKKLPTDLVTNSRQAINALNNYLEKIMQRYPEIYAAGFETGLESVDKDKIKEYLENLESEAKNNPLSLIKSIDYLQVEELSTQGTSLNPEADMFYQLRACLPIPSLEVRLLGLVGHLIEFVKTQPKYIDVLTIRLYQWGFLLEGDSRSHYIEEVKKALKTLTVAAYGVSLIFNTRSIEEDLLDFFYQNIFSSTFYNRIAFSRLNLSLTHNPLDGELVKKNYGNRALLSGVPIPPLLYTELLLTVSFADAVAKYKAFLRKYNNSYQQASCNVLNLQDLLVYNEEKIANLYQMVGPKLFDLLSEKLGGSPLKAQDFLSKWILFKDPNVVRIRQLIERYHVTFNNTKLVGILVSSVPLIMRAIDRYKLAEDINPLHEPVDKIDSIEKIETLLFSKFRTILALVLHVPVEDISEFKLKQFGLDNLIKIIFARELMNEDEYLSVFDVMLLCDLTDGARVAEVMQDAYETNPNVQKQVEHNKQIKHLLASRGIDLKKVENYKPSEPFTYAPTESTEGLEYAKDILIHLENLDNSLRENSSLFQNKSLFVSNKDIYVQCMQLLSECIHELRGSAHWLIKPESRKKLALLKEKIKFLMQAQPIDKIRIIAEFNQQLEHELQDLRKAGDTKDKAFANRSFHVEQWDKKNIKTFFLGDLLSCCLASDSHQFAAMVQRRMDSGAFMHVVIDEKTREPVCGAWLFYSDKNEIIANFLELRDSYAQSKELSYLLTQRLLEYIGQFAQDIGASNFVLRELTYGNLEAFFKAQSYPQLDSSFTVQKVGGFLQLGSEETKESVEERYFFESITKEGIKFFKYVSPQPVPEVEPESPSPQPG